MNTPIDLNADVGEGCGRDEALFAAGITSANVACGGHAGDEATMVEACERCVRHGVSLGAHPGFADRERFGRVELPLDEAALESLVREQVGALRDVAARHGGGLIRHVKPHGALYHLLNREESLARSFVAAVRSVAPAASIFGPPRGRLREAAFRTGTGFVSEGFIDRAYRSDGTLVPRADPGACLADESEAVAQALRLAERGGVDTLCVHGDGLEAARLLAAARRALGAAGFRIEAPVWTA